MTLTRLKGIGIGNSKGSGRVLIISSHQDFAKVKGNEVLVVQNATPDFIVILKKVKCLITDQGGATSHIAIVCRELSIHAIIATGLATAKFHNNDEIYFDTTKGTVTRYDP
ncbi:MAG: PEP-utilizing enzyme [Microgenomates group bacterium]